MLMTSARCIALVLVLLCPIVAATGQTSVATSSGTVDGFVDADVIRFRAIPYAEPPVGAARWTRPVAKSAEPNAIDATVFGPACAQRNVAFAPQCFDTVGQPATDLVGSEDCLTLDITRPTTAGTAPRPVLFWIHGGALVTGCSKATIYSAEQLATKDPNGTIVVSVQYRLGPYGYIAFPELVAEDADGSAGNYGLLDAVLALEWVRDNIAAFGGDPDNVTVFGESAGGGMICALIASPLADDLFDQAIVQSGNCGGSAPPYEAGPGGVLQNTAFGEGEDLILAGACDLAPDRAACMRALTPDQVLDAFESLQDPNATIGGASLKIDGYALSEAPASLLANGAAGRRVTFGFNANELTVFTIGLESTLTTEADLEMAIRDGVGNLAADALLPLYPIAGFATPADAFRAFGEDLIFACTAMGWASSIHEGGGEARLYYLTVETPGIDFLNFRTFHSIDLFYLFGHFAGLAPLGFVPGAGDTALSEFMQDAWTGFAATGTPGTTPAWPLFVPVSGQSTATGSLLELSANSTAATPSLTTGDAIRAGRCDVIASLVGVLNDDLDNILSEFDNCPFAVNSRQTDIGGVGAGSPSDDIGDACQCGDTTDDGVVDMSDVAALRAALVDPLGAALSPAGAAKCGAAPGGAGCSILDSVVIDRAVGSLAPGISTGCDAAASS